jgi:phosphatidylglycerophosphatase A
MKRLAELLGTGLGTGYTPVAPATAASAAAILLYWALPFHLDGRSPWFGGLIAATLLAGIWAAQAMSAPGDKDPKRCVIDEFAGVWTTCILLPATWGWLLAAFVVFRALDIAKPFGIRRLERLPGGLGIMADDLAAGIAGALVLNAIYWGLRL